MAASVGKIKQKKPQTKQSAAAGGMEIWNWEEKSPVAEKIP